MTQEAKVRVRLDTANARKDLEELAKMAEGVRVPRGGGGPGSPSTGEGGGGPGLWQSLGIGAGIASGAALVGSVSRSSFGDVAGEFLGPIAANLSNAIFGDKDEEARASRAAREQTIQTFGSHAQYNREAALNYHNQIYALNLEKEKGATAIRNDSRFYEGKSESKSLADLLAEAVQKAIIDGFNNIKSFLEGLI